MIKRILRKVLLWVKKIFKEVLFWVLAWGLMYILLFAFLDRCSAQMQTGEFGWYPSGVYVAGGVISPFDAQWPNPTGQRIYIWGIQGDLWFGGMIPPGNSLDTFTMALAETGPGASALHYLRNVADIGMDVSISQRMKIFIKGSDHYDNDPELNAKGPYWFPRPFIMEPGDYLFMHSHCGNGFQPYVGGQLVFNASVLVYYTVGTP